MTTQAAAANDPELADQLESICRQFRESLRRDPTTSIEEFVKGFPSFSRHRLLVELIVIHMEHRESCGEIPSIDEYVSRFPVEADSLREQLAAWRSTCVWDGTPDQDQTETTDYAPVKHTIDRYELKQRIGQGGFGEVWSAHDPVLHQTVAIKVLRPDRSLDSESAESLLKEGRRLAGLDHENVVRVLDAGLEEGCVYLVLEYMPGGSLQHRLQQKLASAEEAVEWTIRLALGLHHAHSRGFVHRDIKPSNILFDAESRPHLADFGLAVSEEESLGENPATVGTFAFMSPEQARGESHLTDPRSDVYSLGVVLYHSLTGRLPFPKSSPTKYMEQILTRQPHPLRTINSEIPVALEAICLKCLRTSMHGRFTTALELAEELQRWQSSLRSPRPQRKKWFVAAGLTGLALVAALLAFAFNRPTTPKPQPQPGQVTRPSATVFDRIQPVAWDPYDIHDEYGYDPKQKRFVFDAFAHALFQTGVQQGQSVQLQMEYGVNRWKGKAGCFWNLARSQDGYEHCWAVFAGRTDGKGPLHIEIAECIIGPSVGGRIAVKTWKRMKSVPAFLPKGDRASLKIEATNGEVSQMWLSGTPLLESPFPLPERDWTKLPKPGFGFGGQVGRVSVYSFSSQ